MAQERDDKYMKEYMARAEQDLQRAEGKEATRKVRPYRGRPFSETRTLHRSRPRRD